MRQTMDMQASVEALRQAEKRRNAALVERDFGALAKLLHEDLVHTHSTGLKHDKGSYLKYVGGPLRYLEIERGELQIALHGEVAIMTGDLRYRLQPPGEMAPVSVHSLVLQVWLRVAGDWQMRAFQATRKPPALPSELLASSLR
jgi:ketosteroid isomerase-like protein